MTELEFAQSVLGGEPWVPTPLLPPITIGARLGMELWLKRKDCTPVDSFKLRGALVTMARRAAEHRQQVSAKRAVAVMTGAHLRPPLVPEAMRARQVV